MTSRPQGLGGEPVRAVLFDYGLTLVGFERPVEAIETAQREIAGCIAAAGHPQPAVERLLTAVHDRVEAAVAAHEAGGALEEIDIAAVEREAFAAIGLQLDEGLLDHCSRIAQEAWFEGVRVYPEVADVLVELRSAGLRLGVCSNAPYRPASMRDQLRHTGIGVLVDAAVFSAEVGWRKPSPRIFEAALRALGAAPAATVFVGDRPREDVAGAHAAGMRAVLVRRDAVGAALTEGEPADAVIDSLAVLPALLLPPAPP